MGTSRLRPRSNSRSTVRTLGIALAAAATVWLAVPTPGESQIVWAARGLFEDTDAWRKQQGLEKMEPDVIVDRAAGIIAAKTVAGLQVLRIADGALLHSIGLAQHVRMIPGRSMSADGRLVIVHDTAKNVQVRDVATRAVVAQRRIFFDTQFVSACITPDGNRVLLAGENRIWLRTLQGLDSIWLARSTWSWRFTSLDVGLDGRRCLLLTPETLEVRDMATGDTLWTRRTSPPIGTLLSAAFADSGRMIVTYDGATIGVLDARNGAIVRLVPDSTFVRYFDHTMSVDPGGTLVHTWNRPTTERSGGITDLLDSTYRRVTFPYDVPLDARWAGFDRSATSIAVLTGGGAIHLAPLETLSYGPAINSGGRRHLGRPAASTDGSMIVTGFDGRLGVFEAASGRRRPTAMLNPTGDFRVAISPDRNRIIGIRVDGGWMKTYDSTGLRASQVLIGEYPSPPAYSPDGSVIAYGDNTGTVYLVDAGSLEERKRFVGHGGRIRVVRFSHDGARLLSGGDDGTINVWRIADGTILSTIEAPGRVPVLDLVETPDARRIVFLTLDGLIIEATLDDPRTSLIGGFGAGIEHIDISDDGAIVFASGASTLAIDRATGRVLHRYVDSLDYIATTTRATVVPGTGRLASASSDGDLILWQYAGLLEPTAVESETPRSLLAPDDGTIVEVGIHDVLGRLLRRVPARMAAGEPHVVPAGLIGLPPGAYLVVRRGASARRLLLGR